MQFSHYLKTYHYDEKPGYLLLFSTKKASMILMPEEKYQAIEKGDLSSSDQSLLSRLEMIVPDRNAEKKAMHGYIDEFNEKNQWVHLIVIMNLDCNFACPYCYEEGIKGKFYMSENTADQLIDFIKEKFTPGKKALIIDFHGGEPLLSAGLIKSISRSLKTFAENRGASFEFNIITNGSLFNRKTAEELAPLGLKSVQITIDGPADIHNKSRPFKSGAPSFDIIISNIKQTWDLVKLAVNGNFDSHNYKEFVQLLDYFTREDLGPEKIAAIRFGPVTKSPEGESSLPGTYNGGCISVNEPWIPGALSMLREEIKKRGYGTIGIAPGACIINYTDSYVVNYDGVIYKCPAFVGRKGFEAGDVKTGVIDYSSRYKVGNWKNDKECLECEYLPFCFGGCKYMADVRDGNLDKVECKRQFFEDSLEKIIRIDIKSMLNK